MKHCRYLCFLLIIGCSSTEETTGPKTYSEETNRAFLQIERGDSYYMKKPSRSTPPQIETARSKRERPSQEVRPPEIVIKPARRGEKSTSEEIVIDDKINYQEPQKSISTLVTPAAPKKQKTTKSAPTDERLIEINQNLAFYCMKHRKDVRFQGSEERCMSFVNSALENCQRTHKVPNKKLLGCIQNKLKRR